MANMEVSPEQAARLRQQAEAMARGTATSSTAEIEAMSPAEIRQMLHELRVHQIELEMQNEELRRAQIKLDESRARYFDLYDLAPLGYFTLSPFGLILEANLYAASRLGVSRAALVQQPFTRFILREDQDTFYLHRKRLSLAGSPESWDLRMVGHDGVGFWARLDATSAQAADGTTVIRVVMGDISERKRAEEQQRRLEAQLHSAEKMQSLGLLAGGIAHDMNNVLGAILGLASANLEIQREGTPAYRAFDTICKAAERGGRMVRSLLSLARQRPTEEEDLDLDAIIFDEIRLLEHTTLNKIRMETDLAGDLNLVRGDAGALSHAFMNLFVNSVDAMPHGGTIAIRTRNLDSHQVEVQVEDTGMGMPVEVLKKALDPFFTTKEVGKGTGLGLSIVYSTVMAHHGAMDIQSHPGQGTCVKLRFPIISTSIGEPRPVEALGVSSSQAGLRVLVVDDDDLMQCTMQTLLGTLGHTSIPVSGGEEALEWLGAGLEADVVVLDLNMPGLDGAGTLPRIQALRPAVPILIATGRADQAAQDLISAHPGILLLAKPFSIQELQQQLDRLFSR